MTAGKLVHEANKFTLGKDMYERCLLMKEMESKAEKERLLEKDKKYLLACMKADEVLAKDESSWLVVDYKSVLKPLKREEDAAMPHLKADLEETWKHWKPRKRRKLNFPEMENSLLQSLKTLEEERNIKNEPQSIGDSNPVSTKDPTGQFDEM